MSEWTHARRGRLLVPTAFAVGAACAAGAAAAGLPSEALITLTGVLTGLIVLLLARYFVSHRDATDAPLTPSPSDVPRSDCDTGAGFAAPARYLYFAGMLTIAQTTVRPLLGFTLSDWFFLAALCAALGALVVHPGAVKFRVPSLLVLGVSLFVVSGLLSSVDALQPLQSVAKVLRFGYLTLVWFWLGTVVLASWKDVRAAMGCWITSVAIDGFAAVLQTRGVPVPFLGPVTWGRMTGLTENVNDLGGAAAVALAPALALAFTARRLRGLMYWCLTLAGIVVALVLSGSVGGMAAAIGAVVVWLVVSGRGVRPVILVAAAAVVALGIAQAQTGLGLPTPSERLMAATGQSGGGQYSTIATRLNGYDKAWAGLDGGGWIGVGLDARSADVGPGIEVHNVFLKAWYEAGWLAALGMLLVVGCALGYGLLAARRARSGQSRMIAVASFSATAAFVALSMGAPILHQRYGWVAVALVVACLAVTRSDTGIPADAGGDD